ncbi:MAG: hypothetical protein V3W14_01055 [Candidatus Neomarinimicrobiota bacterium]
MGDRKTKAQLQAELDALRQHIREVEAQAEPAAGTAIPAETVPSADAQSLLDQAAYSRLLIDNSLDMIIAVDKERHITEFNRAMDGLATIKALRKIDFRVPIIAASGLVTEKSINEEVSGSGADAFLAKPYSAQTLLEALLKLTVTPEKEQPAARQKAK